MYKPHLRLALELLSDVASVLRRVERVPTREASSRVAAATVRSPRWPISPVAWKDGVALGTDVTGRVLQQHVATGETVPPWAQRVVPEERFDEWSAREWLDPAREGRPEIMAAGREYQEQTSLVLQGEVISAAVQSQLLFHGVSHVDVWAVPQIALVVAGRGPESLDQGGGAAAAAWLAAYLREWGCPRVSLSWCGAPEDVDAALGESELGFLISDGTPGRYGTLRPLWMGGTLGSEVLFWKWNLLPCKHTGLIRVGGRPVLILPDLGGKSMLSGLVLVPELATAAWCMPPPAKVTVEAWEAMEVEPQSVRITPVALSGTGQIGSVRLDSVFSGRHVSAADGYVTSETSVAPGEPVDVVLCRRREPWGR